MNYKGYVGHVTFDNDSNMLHGEVINTRDVITFQGRSIEEINQAFKDSVDEYLAWCQERGELPEKPFSGKFVVRLSPDLHRSIVTSAKREGKSLNRWVEEHLLASMPIASERSARNA